MQQLKISEHTNETLIHTRQNSADSGLGGVYSLPKQSLAEQTEMDSKDMAEIASNDVLAMEHDDMIPVDYF